MSEHDAEVVAAPVREDHASLGDRPSAHGAALGRFLASLVEAGGGAKMCATCAFREGSMPNTMAGTGLLAMHCALGTDPVPFGCHHGLQDGLPSRDCAGWKAAQRAPFELWKEGLLLALEGVRDGEPNQVRADFEAWWPTVDPRGEMDVYQLGRAWARRSDADLPGAVSFPDSSTHKSGSPA